MLLPARPPVVVEYDGAYWHRDAQERDRDKSADLMATGHLVIRIREQPLFAITPNDVICTPDQSAEEVADLVYQSVLRLTDQSFTPRGKLPAADPQQLDLFEAAPTGQTGQRNASETAALRTVMQQMLLELHRGDVEADLAEAGDLVPGHGFDAIVMNAQRQVGALSSLASVAKQLIDPSEVAQWRGRRQ
ncbi:hypothetical protein [Streptomyces sp. NPDC047525]|uniref:hypothetical protein n=1 Tax=Streptomyces sp. NPDC047525 TaxID=3155264 RepID=UPI0033ED7C56